jgi:hypothetical protein
MKPAQAAVAGLAVLLLAVAACAGTGSGVVYHSDFTAGYDRYSLVAAMSRAPLLVETYGAPGEEQDQAEVSRATARALRQYGPLWLPRNYTASAADAGNGRYRLRVAYAVPQSFDRQQICNRAMDGAALEAARRSTDADSTRTIASLCRGETALGIADGSPGAERDIRSDGFARFVGLLGREVMPRHNPVLQDDCVFRPCD